MDKYFNDMVDSNKIAEVKKLSDQLNKVQEIYNALDGSKTIRLEIIEQSITPCRHDMQKGYRMDSDMIECMSEFFKNKINDIWGQLRQLTIADENDIDNPSDGETDEQPGSAEEELANDADAL